MKATGTTLWTSPNTNATNDSGFTGLPGGYRNFYADFNDIGSNGYWWSLSEHDFSQALTWYLGYNYGYAFYRASSKRFGYSVRCIRD
jgi:uncharacterized protein (TIGR02145 family)